MAYASTSGVWFPMPPVIGIQTGTTAPSMTNLAMTATAHKVAFVFRVTKAGVLNSVGFQLGTVTQAPSNGLKVSFQDVGATTGDPDGTADQYATVTTGLTTNSWVDVSSTGYMGSTGAGSGTKRTVAVGDILSIVIEFASFNASDSLQIQSATLAAASTMFVGNNYADQFGASWAKQSGSAPAFSLKYDDGTYSHLPGVWPGVFNYYTTLNTTSTPDEVALRFTVPFACKIDKIWASVDPDVDTNLILYDTDGTTALETITLDKDIRSTTARNAFMVPLSQERELTPNGVYRISVLPTTTSNIVLPYMDVNANALFGQMDGGTSVYTTTRADAGSWSNVTTRRIFAGVHISSLPDSATGGAGIFQVLDA